MNRVLVEIVAQTVLALEQADESVLDLEAAVKQQEDIAWRLKHLSPTERDELTHLLELIAADNPFEDQRRILRELPGDFGIA